MGLSVVRGVVMRCGVPETAVVQTTLALERTARRKQNIQHLGLVLEPLIHHPSDSHLYCYSLLQVLQDEQYTASRPQLQQTLSG
jgi:hypothetical protein